MWGGGQITPREFKRRNYVEDKPTAIYRNTDVKDTPLSELYEALDIVHGAAAKEMPNPLITKLLMHGDSTCNVAAAREEYGVNKNRASKEANYRVITGPRDKQDPCNVYKGEEFTGPANTARPTVEQFICSIYTRIMNVTFDGEQAQFADSLSAARLAGDQYEIGVNTAFPSDGGSGYVAGQPDPFHVHGRSNGKRTTQGDYSHSRSTSGDKL